MTALACACGADASAITPEAVAEFVQDPDEDEVNKDLQDIDIVRLAVPEIQQAVMQQQQQDVVAAAEHNRQGGQPDLSAPGSAVRRAAAALHLRPAQALHQQGGMRRQCTDQPPEQGGDHWGDQAGKH